MPFQPCTYILTNKPRGRLYVGVTSNLVRRIDQHRSGVIGGFTSRYQLKRVAYFEWADRMETAIAREKQWKRWHREWKLNLVETTNPGWRDLAEDLGFGAL